MYFDPGVDSLMIQAVIAVLVVLGGYFAITKTKLKNLFGKNKDAGADSDTAEHDNADDTL